MRTSFLLLTLAAAAAVNATHRETRSVHLNHRQIFPFFPTASDDSSSSASASQSASQSAASAASSSSAAAAASSSSASQEAAQSSSSAAAQASASRASASSAAAASSSQAAAASKSSAAAASSSSAASASSASAALTSSMSESTVFLTSTVIAPTTSSTDSAASATASTASATASADAESSSGVSKGLIIGVSVAGGVLILAALIFLYMKFGGKRFSGFEDDDADIKWPELKHDPDSAAMQPLPARRTGGAGFDMGDESDNGHEIGSVKGRDSFGGSTTALAAAPPAGYAVNETYPMDQPYQTGHYYHDMYSQDAHAQQYAQDHQYSQQDHQGYQPDHQQQAAGYPNPYEQDAYSQQQQHYAADPYARRHM